MNWIKCSERMPERGVTENTWVLVWQLGMHRPRLLNWCYSGTPHWRNEKDDRMYRDDFTHWMPLPAPPTNESTGGITAINLTEKK